MGFYQGHQDSPILLPGGMQDNLFDSSLGDLGTHMPSFLPHFDRKQTVALPFWPHTNVRHAQGRAYVGLSGYGPGDGERSFKFDLPVKMVVVGRVRAKCVLVTMNPKGVYA